MRTKLEIQMDLKENLKEFLPSVFLLLNDSNINWANITKKYQEELGKRHLKLEDAAKIGKDSISREACFFDVISRVVMGDMTFYNMLKFYDTLFTTLAELTTEAERKLLPDTIYNLMISSDKRYLNFVGELAVLYKMKIAEFELLETEQPLTTNKDSTKIDFLAKKNEKLFLIEVVNIHLPEIVLNCEIIERFITQKINEKMSTKAKNSNLLFYLVPVIWGPHEDIKRVNDCMEGKWNFEERILYPSAYMTYTENEGKWAKNKFATIDKLFDEETLRSQ